MRKKTRGISVRYKLLALLVILPVSVLFAYLFLAIDLFENDKVAYVFDSTASVTRNLAARTRSGFEGVAVEIQKIMGDYNTSSGRIGPEAERMFRRSARVLAVHVYQRNGRGVEKTVSASARLAKSEVTEDLGLNRLSETSLTLAKSAPAAGMRIERVLPPENAATTNAFGTESFQDLLFIIWSEKETVVVSLFRLTDLSEAYLTESFYSAFLVREDGSVLLGTDRERNGVVPPEVLTDWKMFREIASKNMAAGAMETESPNGDRLLVSYARVGLGGLIVVSLVPRSVALRAVALLLAKSWLFFLALVSLAVIVSVFASARMTSALRKLGVAAKEVSTGNFDIQVDVSSKDEVGDLADSFNAMAAEVSRLMRESISKARMEKELETAKAVQETLFPEAVSRIGPLGVAGHYEPASECGGDWWHYCTIGDKVYLWIGDATGHGAPAALVTSAARSASSILEKIGVSGPGEALRYMNQAIYSASKGRVLMTFFVAAFDPRTGQLTYSCASHDPPYLLRGIEKPIHRKDVISLNAVNHPRLGEKSDHEFGETTVQLNRGDLVLFYTDGVSDVTNPGGRPWGERRFLETLVGAHGRAQNASSVVASIREDIDAYRQGAQLKDDVTYFACCWEGAA